MYSVDQRPPAWIESFDKASSDPFVKAFGAYGQQGVPLPSIPQMGNVWANLGLAEYKIASGQDPTSTITKAGQDIEKANASVS
jgi:arabinogalactan oligomer/maltooligosaccharide transport system substrate-binding protein